MSKEAIVTVDEITVEEFAAALRLYPSIVQSISQTKGSPYCPYPYRILYISLKIMHSLTVSPILRAEGAETLFIGTRFL